MIQVPRDSRMPTTFEDGERVVLCGLVLEEAHLNGARGCVVRPREADATDGRVQVLVDGHETSTLVKPVNLQVRPSFGRGRGRGGVAVVGRSVEEVL